MTKWYFMVGLFTFITEKQQNELGILYIPNEIKKNIQKELRKPNGGGQLFNCIHFYQFERLKRCTMMNI